jgi:hypothetical protein
MPTITTVQALLVLKPVIEGATTSTSSSTHKAQLPEGLIPELCAAISRYIHPITVSLSNNLSPQRSLLMCWVSNYTCACMQFWIHLCTLFAQCYLPCVYACTSACYTQISCVNQVNCMQLHIELHVVQYMWTCTCLYTDHSIPCVLYPHYSRALLLADATDDLLDAWFSMCNTILARYNYTQ